LILVLNLDSFIREERVRERKKEKEHTHTHTLPVSYHVMPCAASGLCHHQMRPLDFAPHVFCNRYKKWTNTVSLYKGPQRVLSPSSTL
jgi:hypothetical protein